MDIFKTLRTRIGELNEMIDNSSNSRQFEVELKVEKRATIHAIREIEKENCKLPLLQIKESIYGGKMDNQDFAEIVRKIKQTMEDGFYEDAPGTRQQSVLDSLEEIAEEIELFNRR